MNGAHNYASITHSSFSPTATTRPTSPTPADGRTPAASSPPSPASSAPHPAATEPVTSTARPHDLAAPPLPWGFGDRTGELCEQLRTALPIDRVVGPGEAIRLAWTTRQPHCETRKPHFSH